MFFPFVKQMFTNELKTYLPCEISKLTLSYIEMSNRQVKQEKEKIVKEIRRQAKRKAARKILRNFAIRHLMRSLLGLH